MHVKFADEAVCIGPSQSIHSYLKPSNIIAAAEITNADAIHPGYGFLSENSKFSKMCTEHDIKFIGASSDMISKMGDKASAKATMKKAGVPTIPGSDGIIQNLNTAKIEKACINSFKKDIFDGCTYLFPLMHGILLSLFTNFLTELLLIISITSLKKPSTNKLTDSFLFKPLVIK